MNDILITVIGLTIFCTCVFFLFRNRKQFPGMTPAQTKSWTKMIVFTAFVTPVLMAIMDEIRSGFTGRSVVKIAVLLVIMIPVSIGMYYVVRGIAVRGT